MTLFTSQCLVSVLAIPLHYVSLFVLPTTFLVQDPVSTLTVACPLVLTGHLTLILLSLVLSRSFSQATSVIGWALLTTALATVILHILIVLFGAPIFDQFDATLCFATFLASVIVLPCFAVLHHSPRAIWTKVFLQHCPTTTPEIYAYTQAICTLSGAWIGAIVLPLDWNRDWQRWPISCVISTFLGHVVGVVTGIAWSSIKSVLSKKKNE